MQAEEINISKIASKIVIASYSGWYTATWKDGDKRMAALILPSSSMYSPSPAYCKVDTLTGRLERGSKPYILKTTTVMEMNYGGWRMGANRNQEKLTDISHYPGVAFGAESEFCAWVEECNATHYRFFIGGNPCCQTLLECCCNVAKKYSDKKFFLTVEGDIMIAAAWDLMNTTEVSDNILIFAESYEGAPKQPFFNIPFIIYGTEGVCNDLLIFPGDSSNLHVKPIKPEKAEHLLPWWKRASDRIANKKKEAKEAS